MKRLDPAAIRLITTDLDETLLRKDKSFSEYSRNVLERLMEKGYLVVPASGRDLKRMGENILTMPGIRYAVTLNGAQVYELDGRAVPAAENGQQPEIRPVRRVGEFPLSEEEAILSLDWMRPYCNILEMDTDRGLLREVTVVRPGCHEALTGEPLNEEVAERFIRKRYFFINFDVPKYRSLSDFIKEEHPVVWKVSGFYADRQRFEAILKKDFPDRNVNFCASDDLLTETSSTRASKGNGLRKLMQVLGIPKEAVLVFGDNGNDIDMFHAAGTSVAVGNALPEVQAEADFVCGTNDEDGVAKFLEEQMLG